MSTLRGLYINGGNKKTVGQYLKSTAPATVGDGVESGLHLGSLVEKADYYLPPIDYSEPKNFVKFGSAYEYYKNAFEYIPSYYPYDGSGLEKTNFYNDINPLEKYLLEVIYPRSTGYVTVGALTSSLPASSSTGYFIPPAPQYIQAKGGPHYNTVYDADKNRTSNLEFAGVSGSTVEFFLKKDQLIDTSHGRESERQVIFDLVNGQEDVTAGDYGSLRIELFSGSETQFRFTLMSGTSGFDQVAIPSSPDQITISDGTWRNFSFSVNTSGSLSTVDFYQNGVCVETAITGNIKAGAPGAPENLGTVRGTMIGNIGALRYNTRHTAGLVDGAGMLSASIDEFRFWKTNRNAEQIGRHWFTNVEGGSNTSDTNVGLGVYYKFNEGITNSSSVDSIVLDYSGRVSNGTFTGYDSIYSRNTSSAINELSINSVEERGDPIIRTENSLYNNAKNSYQLSGSNYDSRNSARLINHLPNWIIESEENNANEIISLSQIMASYFDTLYNQIASLSELKYKKYISGSLTDSIDEFPYNDRLVENMGIRAPDLFQNVGALQHFFQRDEQINFDQQLVDIKNSIYKNIYNNLNFILKAKGNEKSIRNFIRCLGIGDEILSLNSYSDGADYELSSSYLRTSSPKKYVDFTGLLSQEDAYASVYQYYDSSNLSSVGSISGSSELTASLGEYAFTFQTEVVFPDKTQKNKLSYDIPRLESSSISGFHTPEDTTPSSNNMTWTGSAGDWGLQLYAVKSPSEYAEISSPIYDVRDAYFIVKNRIGETLLTSSIYRNVYDNQRWNFSITLKPKKYPFSNSVLEASASNSGYELGLVGINYDTGEQNNSFQTSRDLSYISGSNMLAAAKRIYAGAHRTNFSGTLLTGSDVRIGSVRYWSDYLPYENLDAQAREVETHGSVRPYRNAYLYNSSSVNSYVPTINTLALDWDFSTVTGSNASGQFSVVDASSGSYRDMTQGSVFSSINLRQHTAQGNFFAVNSTPVRKEYVYADRLLPPEYISSVETVNVMSQDDETFGRFVLPATNYYALEKSMYRGISNRMLQLFASIDNYNNLVGEPVNKYRIEYKKMEKLREIFFRKVKNENIDLQKYMDYYKWIDSAMGQMIEQLFPASSRYAPEVRNIIESHSLERSKVVYQFPQIKFALPYRKRSGPEGSIGGGNTPIGVEGDPRSPAHPPLRPVNPNNGVQVRPEDLGGVQLAYQGAALGDQAQGAVDDVVDRFQERDFDPNIGYGS
jgi:hypothetical protein